MYLSENDVRLAQQRYQDCIRSARMAQQIRELERVPPADRDSKVRQSWLIRAWLALFPNRTVRAWR